MSNVNPWIRTVYLYLFALVGLAVTVIGLIMLINLGLKAWVFTKADVRNVYYERPISLSFDKELEMVENLNNCSEACELTDSQKQQIEYWLADYQTWRENQANQEKIDYTVSQRHQQGSTAISMIIVGLPLYLYHWMVIKRDKRKEDQV